MKQGKIKLKNLRLKFKIKLQLRKLGKRVSKNTSKQIYF